MPAPTKTEPETTQRLTRFIAQKTGPVVLRDGKHFIDATDPQSVGGPDGHTHRVQEAHEGAGLIRFITCEPCAKALGWTTVPSGGQPDLIVSESRYSDQ